jgi:hypothetical protein
MESDYRVYVPAEHVDKFSRLREVFGVSFSVGIDNVPELPAVTVSHAEPRTSVGSLQRPLIFPHVITRYCRSLWSADRTARFCFAGLVTDRRREVLAEWVSRALPGTRALLTDRTLLGRLKTVAGRALGNPGGRPPVASGDFVFWSSDRGRHFPGKSWDDDYHALLARSQFVLCPSGDHVWSYRFFEAALCGAIPIVEQDCPAYEGFTYRRMNEPLQDARWDRQDALRNFAVCLERLTVPLEHLNAEIGSLLSIRQTA